MNDRLIVFDCDGVLVDSELLSFEGYRRVFARHGLTLALPDFTAGIGCKQADLLAIIAGRIGAALPREAEAELWPEIEGLFATALAPTDGLVPFLERLETRRCVASSSSPERIRRSLAVTGLSGFFGEAVFSTFQVARGKPAPDVFLLAAAEAGVAPERCCVIEDSAPGIRGAIAAGATAIGFTGGGHSDAGHAGRLREAGAHAVAGSWPEVARLLAERGFTEGGPR